MPNRLYIHTSVEAPGFKAWEEGLMLEICGNADRYMIQPDPYCAMNPHTLNNKNKKLLPVFLKHDLKS
jgi:hypothetical protein